MKNQQTIYKALFILSLVGFGVVFAVGLAYPILRYHELPPMTPQPFEMADRLLLEGKTGEALAMYKRGAPLAQSPTIYQTISLLAAELGDRQTRKEALRFLASHRPDENTFVDLAQIALEEGDQQEFIADLKRAIEVNAQTVRARIALCTALRQAGSPSDALPYCLEAARLDPKSAEARNGAGMALAALGRLDEAVGRYREAISVAPESGESRNNLAAALAQSGRNEEAAEQLEQALLYTPNDPRVHRNLGRIYDRLGRSEDAARHYRWASELETPSQPSDSVNSSQAGPNTTGPLP